MHAYCIFAETQKCGMVAAMLRRALACECFSPAVLQRKWVKGQMLEEKHDYLPGYIFLYTEEPLRERLWIDGIIRWLGDGELSWSDREFALGLYEKRGVIGTVKAVEQGDRVRLSDPVWAGLQGEIVKLDRGRRRCCVAFDFDGLRRTVWVGYDLVEAPS